MVYCIRTIYGLLHKDYIWSYVFTKNTLIKRGRHITTFIILSMMSSILTISCSFYIVIGTLFMGFETTISNC